MGVLFHDHHRFSQRFLSPSVITDELHQEGLTHHFINESLKLVVTVIDSYSRQDGGLSRETGLEGVGKVSLGLLYVESGIFRRWENSSGSSDRLSSLASLGSSSGHVEGRLEK